MGYRLSKIYTRTGDDGMTQVEAKKRIAKDSAQIIALGDLDELNCTIGLLLAEKIQADLQKILLQIQQDLFNLGGELCPPHHRVITADKITALEKHIDTLNQNLSPLLEFILPQGGKATTACHFARAVCRRAERSLVTLHQEEKLFSAGLAYLNRLSDFLFVAARTLAKQENAAEIVWENQKK